MTEYIYSFHAAEEAARQMRRGKLIYCRHSKQIDSLIKLCEEYGIRCEKGTQNELDRLAGKGHRGFTLAIPKERDGKEGVSVKEFLEEYTKPTGLVVLLDGVTDPQNLGSIIRSCDQMGVNLLVTTKRRSASSTSSDVVRRVSSGASSWVPTTTVSNLTRTIQDFQEAGWWVYGADMEGEPAYKTNLKGKTVIIMGSEGEGLGQLIRKACDGLISLPTEGRIDSLNVGIASALLMYEVKRQIALN